MCTKRFMASLLALLMLFSLLPAAALAEEPETVSPPAQPLGLNYGYYLIGRYGWTINDLVESRDKFEQSSYSPEEYKLITTLEEGQTLKVVQVSGGSNLGPWFPDPGDNYVVDAAHAGTKIIYFRPTYNSDWAQFGGHIWIDDLPTHHVIINQPEHGTLVASNNTPAEGETVTITAVPDEGYYPNTIKSNDWPPNFNNYSDPYQATFTMPASDVTVYMQGNKMQPAAGFYFPNGTGVSDLGPAQRFIQESSEYGDYYYDAELTEGQELTVFQITTSSGWSWTPSSNDPVVTAEQAGPARIYLSLTQRDGYAEIFPQSSAPQHAWLKVVPLSVPETYNVTVVGGGEGVTITLSRQTAMEGENVDVNVRLGQDYSFVSITVTDEQGNEIETVKRPDGANKYRFVMPASDVTVTVVTKYNPKYQLWVGGIQVTGDNCADILGDGSASYDPAARTLSFSSPEPTIAGAYGGALITYMEEDSLTIEAPSGLHLDASAIPSATEGIYSYYADFVINGDLTLDVPNGVKTYNGTVTISGNVTGSGTSILIQGNAGVTVNGSVTTTNPSNARAIYSEGPVSISGSLNSAGFANTCVYAAGDITIGGDVTIAFSTTTGLCALQSAGGSVSVGGSFSSSAKASQYVVKAAQGFSCAGSVTVFNNAGKGIYAANGPITVATGTWDVTAASEPLKAADGIVIPGTHAITLPEGGLLAETDGFTIVTEADGTPATHVIIEEAETPDTLTVTFDAGEGTVEPATVEIAVGEAIGELPVPTREGGWKFIGWFTAAAENYVSAGQGTRVTSDTIFEESATIFAHWRLPGDVNGDGSVNNKDVIRLQRHLKSGDVEVMTLNLDTNGDGSVNNKDVVRLQRFLKTGDVELF